MGWMNPGGKFIRKGKLINVSFLYYIHQTYLSINHR